ncbi:MAG TPA: glycosyltransferase family 39 protein [Solirubrobacterales bacterium]|nr:glycosyltransferase family 39 protein [Solirubrobacterales bacterium]
MNGTSPAAERARPQPSHDGERGDRAPASILWWLAGLTALGVVVRFASLGVQSYHHDEVITAARVVSGGFVHMLREVKASESNPPLYYVLAWGWAKAFGTGEVGLRSLSALFGAATVPVAYLIGRELASRRAGLVAAAIVAVNPMLIWYSQEARSYALLIFFGALSLLFFVRALNSRGGGRDLALWAVASAAALCSHYFAVFAVGAEAVWLLVALRERRRAALAAIVAVGAVGVALLPLVLAQINPVHIEWIQNIPLSKRLLDTGAAFLAGETGRVIAQPARDGYAIVPALLIGAAFVLLARRGSDRERRGATLGAAVALAVILIPTIAALAGKDYLVERNLLPALVPLALVVAIGFALGGARRLGALLAVLLCAYWLAFDIYVTQTPNLQRPEFGAVAEKMGPPRRPRIVVTWKLGTDPLEFYLRDGSQDINAGRWPVKEIVVVAKQFAAAEAGTRLPRSFRAVERTQLPRLTLTRYVSQRPIPVWFHTLRSLYTGFGRNAVVIDGLPSQASLPRRVGLGGGAHTIATPPGGVEEGAPR